MKLRIAALLVTASLGCMAPAPEAEPAAEPAAAAVGESEAASPLAASASPLRQALNPSLVYLERDGGAWMRGESPFNQDNGCISGHVVGFALWSHNAAASNGYSVNVPKVEQLTAEAVEFISRPGIGRAVTWSQLLLGRSSPADDAKYDWGRMVEGTVVSQESPGHWRARGQFPTQRRPVEESDTVATMWSLLALGSVASGEADVAAQTARRRALDWLAESADGVSGEWLAMRLLTELHFGEPAEVEELVNRLLAEQRSDGGWSWLLADSTEGDTDSSNAYSTGVALYSLRQAGLAHAHPAAVAAVDHLLATQRANGTWEVPSRVTSSKPSAAKDYIYEYWGTAWAVIGLSEMLE